MNKVNLLLQLTSENEASHMENLPYNRMEVKP